jgi:hypothetical protein
MRTVGQHTQDFVNGLNLLFGEKYTFTAMPGTKYDRIVSTPVGSSYASAFAFVDVDGNVYKTAGWKAPAKGIRFTSVNSALCKADPYTSFLYIR